MKIVYVINSLKGGGKERRLLQLLKGLQTTTNLCVSIIVFSSEVHYEEVKSLSCTIHSITSASRWGRLLSLCKTLKQLKPDIVHSWCNLSYVLAMLPLLRVIYKFRYIAGFIADSNKPSFFSFVNFASLISFFFADAVVSNSRAGLIAKHAPLGKSKVIYNGFDFNRIPTVDKSNVKIQLGLQTKYVIAMFASFYPGKDYLSFLRTSKLLSQKCDDVTFLAVGQGCELEYYKKYVEEESIPNVQFLGFRTDVETIMQACDITFLFSNDSVHAEGVSNSIMESMASGNVVIATRGGGTPEIIEDGYNGFIIPPRDAAEGARLAEMLLTDESLRKTIGSNARASILNRFTLSIMVNEYKTLYDSLIIK